MAGGMTRRDLLKAGGAAGALALTADPLVQQALAKVTPPPGKLTDIDHVVILIQENRSFDHYFGTLPGVNGLGTAAAKAVYSQAGYPVEGFEGHLNPFHFKDANCFHDITHSWVPQHESWNNGAMDSFVKTHLADDGAAAGPETMGYYEKAEIPFYYALAEAFTICDSYYCSVLGPTDPNRLMAMTGTIDPDGLNGGPLIETLSPPTRGTFNGKFTWETMPEALTSAGISWKIYNGAFAGLLDNPLTYFKNFQTNTALKEKAFNPKYPQDLREDLRNGTLPQVSWINTQGFETEHPEDGTAAVGEAATSLIVRMLMHHKPQWEKTALFITWDENGGFFDHVAPPVAPPATPGEFLTVPDVTNDSGGDPGPIGLGFRVPLLIVSPFARGGCLSSDTFDHTSLLRFLETRFGVEVPNLSTWRRENTGDLTSAFNFAEPIYKKPKLPYVKVTKEQAETGECTVHETEEVPPNSEPVQGSREWKHPSGP
jgi:phospholipase C